MIRFQHYNIVVHGNPRYRRADFPFEPAEGQTARDYEERVRVTLNSIGHTCVGRAVFQSLFAQVPVYVVPYTAGGCNAKTGQLTSDRRAGIVVRYSPETWAFKECGKFPGYRPDESLFHEMVHASRFTNHGYGGIKHNKLDKDMQDPEELLAVILTGTYRSEKGAEKFNRDYRTGRLVSQVQLEAFLASRREYLDELNGFESDPLVKLVTPLETPFNPFRDLERLRAKARGIARDSHGN